MNFLPLIIFWLLSAYCFAKGVNSLLFLMIGSVPFGAFAVIPPELAAGLTFTPAPVAAVLLAVRTALSPDAPEFFLRNLLDIRSLGLLTLFWIVAVVVTLVGPRLFAGQIEVFPVRMLVRQPVPLEPSPQNISQLLYLTISIITTFVAAYIFRRPGGIEVWVRASVLGGVVAVATGLLDMTSHTANLDWLLGPFRTATYAMMTDNEILGSKRIVGLMSEASAYGSICIGSGITLHFFGRLLPVGRLRDVYVPVLVMALLVMAALSTSSAAYVTLGLFGCLAAAEWVVRLSRRSSSIAERRRLKVEGLLGVIAAFTLIILVMATPATFTPALDMLDRMVLQKSGSSSYAERSAWTDLSWQALLDTYGFGVGMGGARASNFLVATASTTGFLGAALYFGFIAQKLLSRTAGLDRTSAMALINAKWIYPIGFVTGCLVGTSADFGVGGAFLFALMGLSALGGARRKATVRRDMAGGPTVRPLPRSIRTGLTWES